MLFCFKAVQEDGRMVEGREATDGSEEGGLHTGTPSEVPALSPLEGPDDHQEEHALVSTPSPARSQAFHTGNRDDQQGALGAYCVRVEAMAGGQLHLSLVRRGERKEVVPALLEGGVQGEG